MKTESWEFSQWLDKKIEERESIFKYKLTDFILMIFVIVVLIGHSVIEQIEINTPVFVIIPLVLMHISVSQRAMINQEKRIRELEKTAQNKSSDPT